MRVGVIPAAPPPVPSLAAPLPPEREAGWDDASDLGPRLYQENAIPASSALVRRDALDGVGGFLAGEPLPAASDWDLWLRLVAAGHAFMCAPEARIRYRRHEGGL